MSEYYGIDGLEEAKAYLRNDTLRTHLLEISDALLQLESNDLEEIMGYPDNLKVCSCMTLFHFADPKCRVFMKVLNRYCKGHQDAKTVELITESVRNHE